MRRQDSYIFGNLKTSDNYMKKFYLTLICLLAFVCNSSAQDTPLAVSQRVADFLLAHHSHTLSKAPDGHSHVDSYYQEWRYVNGVLGVAMLNLADATDQPKYERFVKDNYDFYFDPQIQRQLKREYDSGVHDNAWRRFFSMSSLDDCGAMGAALSELARRYKDSRYEAYLDKISHYILTQQDRIPYVGIYCRGKLGERTLWLDDLYMCTSFLAHQGSRKGVSPELLQRAAEQVLVFDSLLYDKSKGLYWHCYYYDTTQAHGTAHWGRANGWAFLAQALLLDRLPVSHPLYNRLLTLFRQRVENLIAYQDAQGMWHQLLDKPDSYAETSCTAMFVAAIAHGVNKGWLDASFASVAQQGWKALCKQITTEGQLQGVCVGTGISRDLPFYYNRPTPLNDAHGLGAVVQAGIEMNHLMLNNK